MKKPYIVYSLSKDRTTQKFNKNKFQDIIREIDIFLQNCTTVNINEPKDKLQEAIQYITNNSPMSKSSFGPLELFIYYNFKLIEPATKEELPNQDHVSGICIWFSRGKSCSPTLFFPFEQADKQFWNYVDCIIPFLPFKLEEKYLRIAHVNKQGEIKSFRKIERSDATKSAR